MIIQKLQVLGNDLPPAQLDFSNYCTIVSGGSDTGKTFIYSCLEIMFGSKRKLKDIPEADGYEKIVLNFKSGDKDIEIERALRGGDYRLTINSGEPKVIQRKKLNDFFLSELGLQKHKLRTNQSNATTTLSFSYMRPYFFVDEISIVDDQSPILSGDPSFATREKSLFRLLLTGKDDSDLNKADDPKLLKARRDGSATVTNLIVEKLSLMVGAESNKSLSEQVDRCNKRISYLTETLSRTHTESSRLLKEKQSLFGELDTINNDGVLTSETLNRFTLLNDAYRKDLERLSFIAESKHFVEQLPAGKCPYCNREMDHIHDGDKTIDPFDDEMISAVEIERGKISFFQKDLEETILNLKKDREALRKKRLELNSRISQIDGELSSQVNGAVESIQTELISVIEERDSFMEQKLIIDHISEVKKANNDIRSEKASVAEEIQEFGTNASIFELEQSIEGVLLKIFKTKKKVTFDKEIYDIIIDGRARSSFGKGMRSVYRTAFHLGLMNLSIAKNIPHPRFLVIDSPVTAHEEADDKIDSGIQASLWDYLAGIRDAQILIFENKEPSNEIQKRVKYYHFNAIENDINCGFFPPKKRD